MNLFVNPTEHRLRAAWRLLIHTLFVLIFTLLIGGGLLVLANILKLTNITNLPSGEVATNTSLTLYSEFAFACGVTLATFLARRWLDKRSFRSLGLHFNHNPVMEILVGFILAGLMMSVIYILEWSGGLIEFKGFVWQYQKFSNFTSSLLKTLLLFILVGWTEELLSRGYHLQNLTEGLNKTWGIILTSSIFALLHLGNPGFTIMAIVGLFLSGLFFCYAFYQRKNLWLPIGLHIGWNFFEGSIFGFQVSGLTDLPRLIYQTTHGNTLITGGDFGPEAGIVLLAGLLIGVLGIYGWGRISKIGELS
ncbi:MAG: lysostaphin resistance A-like protein [Anaerolineales bacterium]